MFKSKRFSHHPSFQQYYNERWEDIRLSRILFNFPTRFFLFLSALTLVSSPFLTSESITDLLLIIFPIGLLSVFLMLAVYSLLLNVKLSKEVKQLPTNEINQKTKMLTILFKESIVQIFHTVSLILNLFGFFIVSYILQLIGFKISIFNLDFSFLLNAQLFSAIVFLGTLLIAITIDIIKRLMEYDIYENKQGIDERYR